MLNHLKFGFRFFRNQKRIRRFPQIYKHFFSTSKTEQQTKMENNQSSLVINHKIDRYQAATIDPQSVPTEKDKFEEMIKETLAHFKKVNVRGVWLKLELDRSKVIPIALKYGFKYHHTKKDYLMMQHWLDETQANKLPHYTTHFVGVGGIVINEEKDEILLIQERIYFFNSKDQWKIPGGLVDDNEYISEAAVREVWEETGIKAKFHSLLGWRERTTYKWGQADIYFFAIMTPETYEIKIDPLEIKTARWMKIDEYLSTPNMYELQKRIANAVGKARRTGIDKLKALGDDLLLDLVSYTSEEFTMKLGADHEISGNILYTPNVLKKISLGKEKL